MKLVIEQKVFDKVMHWVNKSSFEVSGLGIVKLVDNVPTVVDAILIEQENSSAETEMKAEAIAKAEYECRNVDGELRWWWHSHVQMACFWSGTDMTTIRQLGRHGWFFHTVFNQKSEYKTALSCPSNLPFVSDVHFYDDVKTEFPSALSADELTVLDREYSLKVTNKSYSSIADWRGSMDVYEYEGANRKKSKRGKKQERKLLEQRDLAIQEEVISEFDVKAEIFQMMEDKYSDTEIEHFYGDVLKQHKLNVKYLRDEYDMKVKGYGYSYGWY
jgi:hypothetical protein